MHRAGPDGLLIAGERRRSSEPASRRPFSIAVRMCSAASPAPPAASSPHSSEQGSGQDGDRQRNRLAGQGRNAARQLGGEISWRQRQPRQAPAFDRLMERDHELEQPPLQLDGGAKLGPGVERWRSSALGGGDELVALGADGTKM